MLGTLKFLLHIDCDLQFTSLTLEVCAKSCVLVLAYCSEKMIHV